jgi:hypothetical protein
MRPKRCSIITRPAAWLAKKVPLTLTSTVRSKSASVTSSAGLAGPRPALFTRMSSRPSWPTGGVDRRADLVQVADVHRQAQRPAAHALDPLGEVGAACRVAEPQGHVGAGVRQRQRDRVAKPPGGAGHQRRAALEVEAGKVVHDRRPPLYPGA